MRDDEASERFARARALHRAGHLDAAEQQYRRLVHDHPSHAEALHHLGLVELARGRPAESATWLRAAVEAGEAGAPVHLNLGAALLGNNRAAEAAASYRAAAALAPDWAAAHNGLGVALQATGDAAGAIEAFERAVDLEPDSADATTNLGALHQEAGHAEAAIHWYRRAVALDPRAHDVQRELGNVLLEAGRVDEALAACEQAVALEPRDAASHYALGFALDEQARTGEAAGAYRQAVELDPGHADAWANLARILLEAGQVDDAVEHLQQALAARPGDPDIERRLRGARSRQLPPWHLRMLADEGRNALYREAIERAVGPDDTVLDIGTGSGLLAMMAARAGARSVIACEASTPLAAAAADVIRANDLAGRIHLVPRRSTTLEPGVDLPAPATVIVSEIVDVGLLAEGVLPTVRHALARLAAPDATVIPASATVHARLVEIPSLGRVHPLGMLSGFDLSEFDRFRAPGEYVDLDLDALEHQALTDDFEVARFDLARPPARVPENDPRRLACTTTAIAAGRVHAVAMWFDLALDEVTTVSTRPGSGITAWGQAVQFFERHTAVHPGQPLALTARVSDTRIEFDPPETGDST